MPLFSNFIGPDADLDPIETHHDLWRSPLPRNRTVAAGDAQTATAIGFSYGDYFNAAQTFLADNRYENLRKAVAAVMHRQISADAIDRVDLHLVKHGQFYHPACVTVNANGQEIKFVLNVAFSKDGQKIIAREFNILKRLNDQFPISFLPKVYAFGQVPNSSGACIKMFIGEWFEDYHEFHLSRKLPSNQPLSGQQVLIWRQDHTVLEKRQTLDLIQQASMILTFYYNPETFEHIFPWHHAAGDFVVKLTPEKLSVKLISVRDYIPLMQSDAATEPSAHHTRRMLEALLMFFVHLTLRMRIDRADGVGDVVLHHEKCIPAIARGFFQGLDLVASMRNYPDDFGLAVLTYLRTLSSQELSNLVNAYLERYSWIGCLDNDGVMPFDLCGHVHSMIGAIQRDDINLL